MDDVKTDKTFAMDDAEHRCLQLASAFAMEVSNEKEIYQRANGASPYALVGDIAFEKYKTCVANEHKAAKNRPQRAR